MIPRLVAWTGVLALSAASALAYAPQSAASLFVAYWVAIGFFRQNSELKRSLSAPLVLTIWVLVVLAAFASAKSQ